MPTHEHGNCRIELYLIESEYEWEGELTDEVMGEIMRVVDPTMLGYVWFWMVSKHKVDL